MSDYLRNRPFLCVQISYRPAASVNTGQKGWQSQEGAQKAFDKVTIVDRVSNTLMRNCAVIIDIINSEVIKNNTGRDGTQLRADYMGRYSEEIKDSLTIWAVKEAQDRVEQ